jgi:hypothetical protein
MPIDRLSFVCVQYAQVGDRPMDMPKAFHRHRVLASVVLGWIAALTVLLISLHFELTWWIALLYVIALWVFTSLLAYYFLVPYLLRR